MRRGAAPEPIPSKAALSSHGVTLAEPTADADLVAEAAARALERFDLDRPVRLVGVRAEMTPPVVQDGG